MPAQPKNFDAAARETFVAAGVGLVWVLAGVAILALGSIALLGWLALAGGVALILVAAVLAALILREGREVVSKTTLRAADALVRLQADLLGLQALESREHARDAYNEAGKMVELAFQRFAPQEWWDELAKLDAAEASMFPMPALDPELKEGLDERRYRVLPHQRAFHERGAHFQLDAEQARVVREFIDGTRRAAANPEERELLRRLRLFAEGHTESPLSCEVCHAPLPGGCSRDQCPLKPR